MPESQPISSSFRLDVPRGVLLSLLRAIDGPYSFDAACISYRLDCDAGTIQSIREYARIWRWPKWRVEQDLPQIRKALESWGVEMPERHDRRGGTRSQCVAAGSDKVRTKSGQSSDKIRTKVGEFPDKKARVFAENRDSSDRVPDKIRTKSGQSPDKVQTHTKQPTEEEEERERESRANAAVWTAETLPIYDAFTTWLGLPPSAAMTRTVHLLLQPRGSPQGAQIPETGLYGKLFNGYTVAEIVGAVERFAMSAHHKPAVLVKHVAGLITEPKLSKSKQSNGQQQQSPHDKFRAELERQRRRQ